MIDAKDAVVGFIFNRKHGKGWTQTVLTEEIIGKIFSDSKEYALNDFEPIHLTPEILEACDFKKWDEDEQSGITRYTKTHSFSKDFLIYLYSGGKIEFCIDCDEFSKVLNEVYSLHHLQNLYFALTGKELTYNHTIK